MGVCGRHLPHGRHARISITARDDTGISGVSHTLDPTTRAIHIFPCCLNLGALDANMASFLRLITQLGRRRSPLAPRTFTNQDFHHLPPSQKTEEETIPGYLASRYYPVRTGETLESRYQVVGKLGFGTTSTVWLARNLKCEPCHPHPQNPSWLRLSLYTDWSYM